MSYFEVELTYGQDGINLEKIHDPRDPALALADARANIAFAEAGSFDFTIGPDHPFYDSIVPFGSYIHVLEDGVPIFYGRPLYPQTDIYGRKTFHCEGALAFLNDVVLSPILTATATDKAHEKSFIDYHNDHAKIGQKLTIEGAPRPPEGDSYLLETDFITVKEALGKILEHCGGYFYTTIDDNLVTIFLNWVAEPPAVGLVPIEVGFNMLDMAAEGREYYTAAIAKGTEVNQNPVQMYEAVTIPADVVKYGFICKYLEFPDESTVAGLQTKCAAWLASQNVNEQHIDVTALDLHAINGGYEMFMIGRGAHIVNRAIGLDVVLPITSVTIDINTGQKSIGVGGALTNSLTRPKRQTVAKQNQLYLVDSNGNKYYPYVDSNGDVKATNVVQSMRFTKEYTGPYYVGDKIDTSNLYGISGKYGDGTEAQLYPSNGFSFDITPAIGYTFQEDNNPAELIFAIKKNLVPSVPDGLTSKLNFAGERPGPDLSTVWTPVGNYVNSENAYWSVHTINSGTQVLIDETYSIGDGIICIVFLRTSAGTNYLYPLFATGVSGKSITLHRVETNASTQEIISDVTTDYSLASSYTYDGRTVYYHFAYGSAPVLVYKGAVEASTPYATDYTGGISAVSAEAGKIAWTLIYGGQNENDNY